jgi:hypothetical protein
MTLDAVRDAVVGAGVAGASEFDRLRERVHAIAEDPSTIVASSRFFQVWGYRPGGADGSTDGADERR